MTDKAGEEAEYWRKLKALPKDWQLECILENDGECAVFLEVNKWLWTGNTPEEALDAYYKEKESNE